MTPLEKAELRMLKESLDRADHLASAQCKTIAALEQALSECQRSRDSLQIIAANQQQRLRELGE